MKDKATAIRNALKEAGYNSRKVSVRSSRGSFDITIKDATISRKEIEKLTKEFESVMYDQATGCILRGGNTFVFVKYSDEVKNEMISKVLPDVERTMKELDEAKSNVIKKINENFELSYDVNYDSYLLWTAGECGKCLGRFGNKAEQIAYAIATNG